MVRSGFVRVCLLLVCLVATAPAHAREAPSHPAIDPHRADGSAIGAPIDLTSNWLLQQGDDPRYADPAFDDSKWMIVQSGKTLASYGLRNVDEVWYRTHVRIPPNQQNLSVLMRFFGGSYTIFVNGIEVGSSGPHLAAAAAAAMSTGALPSRLRQSLQAISPSRSAPTSVESPRAVHNREASST